MINKYFINNVLIWSFLILSSQSCTIYYVQNDSAQMQNVKIIYNQINDKTEKNEMRLIRAEKAGKIVELYKRTEGNQQVFFDFKLPPKYKLPLNRLLSSPYFDTSSYASICYPVKNTYGIDTISCIRFDQLSANTKSVKTPLFLIRNKRKISIK